MRDAADLEDALGLSFRDRRLLEQALTHRSFSNEQPGRVAMDNERLEFLGDAVLAFVVSDMLFGRHPDFDEGQLSRSRASLVSRANLVTYAEQIELGEYLRLGKGEEISGGRAKPALLGNAFEAVIGALYLDSGLEAARDVLMRFLEDQISTIKSTISSDYKSILQELIQNTSPRAVEYRTVAQSGPDHRRRFRVEAWIGGRPVSEGTGSTKKAAEQMAAERALANLGFEGRREPGAPDVG
jgi:ribonuclease-3